MNIGFFLYIILLGVGPGLLLGMFVGFKICSRQVQLLKRMHQQDSKDASELLAKNDLQEKLLHIYSNHIDISTSQNKILFYPSIADAYLLLSPFRYQAQ